MATEKILETRISLLYNTYDAWVAADPILKRGEIAIVEIAAATNNVVNESAVPTILFKAGALTGDKKFSQLEWASAKAADVHSWAKKSDTEFIAWAAGKIVPKFSVEVTGTGNAVTNASWDSANGKLTLTKGETFATKSDFDSHAHDIAATDDDVVIATGGELSVDIKHAKQLGEGKSYNTGASTGVSEFGKSATIKIPSITVNEYGHITKAEDKDVIISIPTPETVTLPTVADTAEDGKFVTEVDQTDGAITVTRKAVEVVHADGQIYLTIGGQKIGSGFSDADFVKDGMLESVTKSESDNTITFKWNTDAGISETIIDIDDLVEVYTAGSGIEVDNFVISHAIPETVAANVTKTARTYISGIEFDEFGHVTKVETGVEEDQDLTHDHDTQYKKLQTAVTEVGDASKTLKISQDEQGVVTATPVKISIAQDQVQGLTDVLNSKANDSDLAAIAKSGNVNDLIQTTGDVLILDCNAALFGN